MKAFQHWFYQEVEETFGLHRNNKMPRLQNWLNADISLSEKNMAYVQELQEDLLDNVLDWNEDEMKLFFIGPLLRMIFLKEHHFKPFASRKLSMQYGNSEIKGIVDFMVAQGKQVPRAPIFCIHEFKPETGTSNDPLGQLLIAMVTAQQINATVERVHPIYGAYILGRNWFFVILDDKEYAISDAYVATQKDVIQIVRILEQSKQEIEDFLVV
ncbi:MAG: hypothetical protein AAF849_08445 [Bacteroidota bacterium]